jgi:hypothetical protein
MINKESNFNPLEDLPLPENLQKFETNLENSSDYQFPGENTKTQKELKTPKLTNFGDFSEFHTESEFDFDHFSAQNIEISIFVKLSEMLSKVLIRRDELLKLFALISSHEEEFKKLYGVNKAPHLMKISERHKYIKEEITDLINKKGSKISPLGSPKVQKLITTKKSFKAQRYEKT